MKPILDFIFFILNASLYKQRVHNIKYRSLYVLILFLETFFDTVHINDIQEKITYSYAALHSMINCSLIDFSQQQQRNVRNK
jgi:hypothetical protein